MAIAGGVRRSRQGAAGLRPVGTHGAVEAPAGPKPAASGEVGWRRETLGSALLLILAAGLRLVRLDRGITGDEVILYGLAGRPLGEIYGAVMAQEVYSPLGAYLLHLWMRLGAGEVWARLYFVLFGLGLCAVVYSMSRELLGRRGALLVLAAAAASPLLIASSQYIRGYADGSFWSALGLVALIRIWRGGGGRGAWLVYAGATLVAFYIFYFTLLVWITTILWLGWRLWRESRPWRAWAAVHAGMAAGMVPGFLMAWYQLRHNASATRFNWAGTGFQLGSVHVGIFGRNLLALFGFDPAFGFPGISRVLPAWILAVLLAAVSAGCAIVVASGWRRLRAKGSSGGASFCIAVSVIPLVVSQAAGEMLGVFANAKYLLVPHVVFLMVMVVAALSLSRRGLAVAACALIILVYASRLEAVYQPEYDARGAERYVAAINSPGTMVLVLGPYPVADRSGLPWLDVQPLVQYDFPAARYRLTDRRTLDAAMAGSSRVIYVRLYSNQEVFGGNAVILDYLATRRFALQHTERFKNIDVMIFTLTRSDAGRTLAG